MPPPEPPQGDMPGALRRPLAVPPTVGHLGPPGSFRASFGALLKAYFVPSGVPRRASGPWPSVGAFLWSSSCRWDRWATPTAVGLSDMPLEVSIIGMRIKWALPNGDGDAEGDGGGPEGILIEESPDGVNRNRHERLGPWHLDEGDGEVDASRVGEPGRERESRAH